MSLKESTESSKLLFYHKDEFKTTKHLIYNIFFVECHLLCQLFIIKNEIKNDTKFNIEDIIYEFKNRNNNEISVHDLLKIIKEIYSEEIKEESLENLVYYLTKDKVLKFKYIKELFLE